jgi:hypothetical protein
MYYGRPVDPPALGLLCRQILASACFRCQQGRHTNSIYAEMIAAAREWAAANGGYTADEIIAGCIELREPFLERS